MSFAGGKKALVAQEHKEKTAATATDLQRIKLERLLKNIDKPAPIPAPRKEREPRKAPDFVRNVVGSSAGAGSKEYHIYRITRKREMTRLEYLERQAAKAEDETTFQEKLDKNQQAAEERTAKKRAKRLRKKERARQRKKQKTSGNKDSSESDSNEESDEEEDNEQNNDENKDEGEKDNSESDAKQLHDETTVNSVETADGNEQQCSKQGNAGQEKEDSIESRDNPT